jgi:Cu/Ag efflux protein CusF
LGRRIGRTIETNKRDIEMKQVTIKHDSIDEVRINKDRQLIIVVKTGEECKRLKKHLLKQSGDDKID